MCLAVPGRIVSRDQDIAKVDFGGVRKEISLAFTPEARIGEYVLVHAGFALNVLDEEEANRVFEALDEIR